MHIIISVFADILGSSEIDFLGLFSLVSAFIGCLHKDEYGIALVGGC